MPAVDQIFPSGEIGHSKRNILGHISFYFFFVFLYLITDNLIMDTDSRHDCNLSLEMQLNVSIVEVDVVLQ